MLKKTITFEDLDGNPVTDDFYFNLDKGALIELNFSYEGGFEKRLRRITEAEELDGRLVMSTFKDLVKLSIGKRSEDNRQFIQNQAITDAFMQSNAYSVLLMELVTNADSAVAFFTAMLPSDMQKQVDSEMVGKAVTDIALPKSIVELDKAEKKEPAWIRENREPNEKELREATPDQLRIAFQMKSERLRQASSSGNIP